MENGILHNEEERLKRTIMVNLETQFIDGFDRWLEKAGTFNAMIVSYNGIAKKSLPSLTYDEFCVLVMRGSRNVLDEYIKIENIIPDDKEIDEIRNIAGNADDFKAKYALMIEAKYEGVKRELASAWDDMLFRFIINEKYGTEHYDEMLLIRNGEKNM